MAQVSDALIQELRDTIAALRKEREREHREEVVSSARLLNMSKAIRNDLRIGLDGSPKERRRLWLRIAAMALIEACEL